MQYFLQVFGDLPRIALEPVMHSGENRIEMLIHDRVDYFTISVSRIPKPFLIEFITASSATFAESAFCWILARCYAGRSHRANLRDMVEHSLTECIATIVSIRTNAGHPNAVSFATLRDERR
jgi:hypothetical protein